MISKLPLGASQTVLDLATGTGDVAFSLASQAKVSRVIGMDLSESMLEVGKQKLENCPHKSKVSLIYGDALNTGLEDNSVEAVTISFGIRNMVDPVLCLKECYRVLKPGGRVIVLESGRPENSLMKNLNNFYVSKIMPKIGKALSGHDQAYTYLNKTVSQFPSGNDFLSLMGQAGLISNFRRPLFFGSVELYWGTK